MLYQLSYQTICFDIVIFKPRTSPPKTADCLRAGLRYQSFNIFSGLSLFDLQLPLLCQFQVTIFFFMDNYPWHTYCGKFRMSDVMFVQASLKICTCADIVLVELRRI